jgi:hypothetical protein
MHAKFCAACLIAVQQVTLMRQFEKRTIGVGEVDARVVAGVSHQAVRAGQAAQVNAWALAIVVVICGSACMHDDTIASCCYMPLEQHVPAQAMAAGITGFAGDDKAWSGETHQ